MGIAAPPCHHQQGNTTTFVSHHHHQNTKIITSPAAISGGGVRPDTASSMSHSQGFHHGSGGGGGFGFSSGGDGGHHDEQHHQQHVAQQSRRDKLRVQGGFDPAAAAGHGLLQIDGDEHGEPVAAAAAMYDHAEAAAGASNMLSEMFNFPSQPPPTAGPSATELLASQMNANYARFGAGAAGWFASAGGRTGLGSLGETSSPKHHQQQQPGGGAAMASLAAADPAAAMHLFLMNPHQQNQQSRSSNSPPPPSDHEAAAAAAAAFQAFGGGAFAGAGAVEGQGLSLSLSSSLQQQAEEQLRVRDGVLYFNRQQQLTPMALHGGGGGGVAPVGYGPAGVAGVLRNSKYTRAAQELLEEFCSVGRGQIKGGAGGGGRNPKGGNGGGGGASSSGAAQSPPSAYNHYCDQMQMVVNFFDSVMGFGAATPYTALAQKAMSRHFRCLKDAIAAQLRHTCELLGEKDAGTSSGLTKGETPRLRAIDQSLRQQRAFHHMGIMEQEAWRPQRGLPERSVNILRSWLFEHFLHPYPSDADKHLLARQTGLSRNQVSNWFINARVRLWKPMIEEMYQQECKEFDGSSSAAAAAGDDPSGAGDDTHSPTTTGAAQHHQHRLEHGGASHGFSCDL
uniref:Homeobox domain-containing protein n=1 Tax=Leersia perrieri TaxID=77586 RepID=A0A0D9VYM1_9ORYZ